MARRARRGFTLVELLVVVTIIAMLMGLLVPAVIRSRETARRGQCLNNMRQYGMAVIQYEAAKQKMPGWRNRIPSASNTVVGLTPVLLPYLGRSDLYKSYLQNGLPQVFVDITGCPSDATPFMNGRTNLGLSYLPNGGRWDRGKQAPYGTPPLQKAPSPPDPVWNGVFFDQIKGANATSSNWIPVVQSMSNIVRADGTSTTLMLCENVQAMAWCHTNRDSGVMPNLPNTYPSYEEAMNCMVWDPSAPTGVGINKFLDYIPNPVSPPPDPSNLISRWDIEVYARPSSYHVGGVNISFCDGHIQFIGDSVDVTVFALICTPDGRSAGQTALLDPSLLEQ